MPTLTPEAFAKYYDQMMAEARASPDWAKIKNSPEFIQRMNAEYDQCFNKSPRYTGIEPYDGPERCTEHVSDSFVRFIKQHGRTDQQCTRPARFLVDGDHLCRMHAAFAVLDELTGDVKS